MNPSDTATAVTPEDVRRLASLVEENQLTELRYESGPIRLTLRTADFFRERKLQPGEIMSPPEKGGLRGMVPVAGLMHALVPRVAQIAMNTSFRMFPDSDAAKGEKGGKPQLSAEAIALQQMMRGIHF